MHPRTDSRQNFSKFSNLPICSHIFPYFPIHQNPFRKSKPITIWLVESTSSSSSQHFFWSQPGHLCSDARDLASGLQCYGHHLHIFARGPRGPRGPWTVLGQSLELAKRRGEMMAVHPFKVMNKWTTWIKICLSIWYYLIYIYTVYIYIYIWCYNMLIWFPAQIFTPKPIDGIL